MRNAIIFTLCLLLIIALSGCAGGVVEPGRFAKRQIPKDAPPEYVKGWEDGCETGLASQYSNTWYKTFHKYKKDMRLITDQRYNSGWNDAFNYCRHWSGQWVRWGYFDDGDSLRDKNPFEGYSFEVPGWNGVKFVDNNFPGMGKESNPFGPGGAADTLFGWNAAETSSGTGFWGNGTASPGFFGAGGKQ